MIEGFMIFKGLGLPWNDVWSSNNTTLLNAQDKVITLNA